MLLLILTLTLGIVDADELLFMRQLQAKDRIMCPDQSSNCPDTATCCQMSNGRWGCCPFARASCCSDNIHCCPEGYSCNQDKGHCAKAINDDTIPWAKKEPALSSDSSPSEVASPSNGMTCPDSSVCAGTAACCRTYTGNFRCCQYPNDVCCSDGQSCCPRSTMCDLVNRKCIAGFATDEWKTLTASNPAVFSPKIEPAAQKVPATVVAADAKKDRTLNLLTIVWCDLTHYCPGTQTCCMLPNGQWGCCAYTQATCCTGSYLCCPFGSQCTNPPGGCY